MPRLIWSPPALLDVQRAYRFLTEKDAGAARRAVSAIRSSVKAIEQHPNIGRPIEDMETEYREWLIDFADSGYIALYRYQGDSVVILAVRHQKEAGY